MHLVALFSAMALSIGSVDAVPQPATVNAHRAREVPAKYLYRAKYHSRLHSMPPVFVEPPVSIASLPAAPITTIAPPPINHAFPPGPHYRRPSADHTTDSVAITTTTAVPQPWSSRSDFFNATRPWGDIDRDNRWVGIRGGGDRATHNFAGHGRGSGHWMTSSCTSHIVSVTLTQTVNVTVTVTATATPWASTTSTTAVSYHTINGTLVPCSSSSTASVSVSGGGSSASHDHAWPWVWPRPSSASTTGPAAGRTQTITLTLSHATVTRSRTHTVTITDAHGNLVPVPTACVIDPLLRPVITGAGHTRTFGPAALATATVCAKNAPSGVPLRVGSAYCGVRGRAVAEGSGHFLGRFAENAAGEDITMEGCWLFCERSTFGASHGCRSYGFYRDDVGKPHCDLYGSPVAYALDVVDGRQNSTWFDKECGNPTDDKWHTGGTEPRPDSGSSSGGWGRWW